MPPGQTLPKVGTSHESCRISFEIPFVLAFLPGGVCVLLTVRGIVTLQFVRLRASRMALACARRRAPEKNPGTRRRTAARIVARTKPVFKNERSIY